MPALKFGYLLALLPKPEVLIPDRMSIDRAGQLTSGEQSILPIATEDHLSENLGLDVADPSGFPGTHALDGGPSPG